MVIEDVPEDLGRGGDDSGAAGGADGGVEGAVGEGGDDGGDGGEGAFAGADVVCYGGSEAEFVADSRDGEVVHFIVSRHVMLVAKLWKLISWGKGDVQDDAGFWFDDLGSEKEIDSCRQGDGHARLVSSHNVRSAMVLRYVKVLRVVVLCRMRLIIPDSLVNGINVLRVEHLLFKTLYIGIYKLWIAKADSGGVREAHGFGEAMAGQVLVSPVFRVIALHDFEDLETDGAAGGGTDAVESEASISDIVDGTDDDFVIRHVVEGHCPAGASNIVDNGLGCT